MLLVSFQAIKKLEKESQWTDSYLQEENPCIKGAQCRLRAEGNLLASALLDDRRPTVRQGGDLPVRGLVEVFPSRLLFFVDRKISDCMEEPQEKKTEKENSAEISVGHGTRGLSHIAQGRFIGRSAPSRAFNRTCWVFVASQDGMKRTSSTCDAFLTINSSGDASSLEGNRGYDFACSLWNPYVMAQCLHTATANVEQFPLRCFRK